MPVDMKVWKKLVKDAVSGIADESLQRRAWFGIGPEVSSPEEEFCQLFNDASIEEYFDRNDNGLNQNQLKLGKHLVALMNDLGDEIFKSQKFVDPNKLIEDPRWIKIREAARKFLEALE